MSLYPIPAMRGPNGRKRFAFVTLLTLNDSYLPAALLLAYGLRQQQTEADLVCLVTPEISPSARQALAILYDHVLAVEPLVVPHRLAGTRPYLPYVFSKLHALRLGADGDLGLAYEKICLLDADLLPLKWYDHLFTLPTPAGTINEHKRHVMAWGTDGNFIVPPSVQEDGRWHWHTLYADCAHGQPIPKAITDRVAKDPSNMGVISSLWVLRPSLAEYAAIRHALTEPTVRHAVSQLFEWPEMQYLTGRWSGQWTNVDLRFHSLNGYPDLSVLYGVHYTGFKPWQFRREGSMERYGRRADFRLWHQQYLQMMAAYPALARFKRLQGLAETIRTFVSATAVASVTHVAKQQKKRDRRQK